VSDDFWVDVYFDAAQTASLNHQWDEIADHRAAWGVTDPIPAGGSTRLAHREWSGGLREILEGVDSVVLAVGAVSHDPLSKELWAAGLKPVLIGDCVRPGNAGDAIRAGYEAGLAV
jgi:hypothetical protein